MTNADYCTPARDQIESIAPATLLALGKTATALCREYCARHRDARLHTLSAAAVTAARPPALFDLAMVTDLVETMALERTRVLLAALRDHYCRRLLLGVAGPASGGSGWKRNDLFALGLIAVCAGADQHGRHWYYHDLADYKSTPDWLNSKYWAHPERFDK